MNVWIPSWRLSAFVQKHYSPLATRQYRNRYSVGNLVSNYLQIRSKRFLEIISYSHECLATQTTSQIILKQQQTIMSNLIPHRIWYQGKWISDDLWWAVRKQLKSCKQAYLFPSGLVSWWSLLELRKILHDVAFEFSGRHHTGLSFHVKRSCLTRIFHWVVSGIKSCFTSY